jgi:hypothetical protein
MSYSTPPSTAIETGYIQAYPRSLKVTKIENTYQSTVHRYSRAEDNGAEDNGVRKQFRAHLETPDYQAKG